MKRKTFSSRLLAILMTVALVLSFASVSAFAEGETNGESSSPVTIQKYEKDQIENYGTKDFEANNEYGIKAGSYIAFPVQENQIVILKQNDALYLVFGISKNEMTEEIWTSIKNAQNKDGSIKDVLTSELSYPIQNEQGIFAYESQDTNEGNYYYGYKDDNGQMYLLISALDKVSHIDVVSGITPSTPEKPNIPSVKKEVSADNGTSYSTEVSTATGSDDTVIFKLTTNVPETTSTTEILIHDRMNSAFEVVDSNSSSRLDSGDFTVTLGNGDSGNLNDYITVSTTELGDDCTFHLTINVKAAEEAGVIENSDFDNTTPIVITYTANLKDATAAGAYTNTAWTQETSPSTVTVDTYGIQIVKYDASTATYDEDTNTLTAKDGQEIKYLAGAVFDLYPADETDSAKPAVDPIRTGITTGEDGKISINGLAEGTYYLKETDAPDGYVEPTNPIKVVVSPGTDSKEYYVTAYIPNTEQGHTGGAGTMFYTFGGLAIVAAAGAVFLASRKSRKQSA